MYNVFFFAKSDLKSVVLNLCGYKFEECKLFIYFPTSHIYFCFKTKSEIKHYFKPRFYCFKLQNKRSNLIDSRVSFVFFLYNLILNNLLFKKKMLNSNVETSSKVQIKRRFLLGSEHLWILKIGLNFDFSCITL